MKPLNDGLRLALKHRGVIIHALNRLHLRPYSPDFEDFLHEGLLIYARYYGRYQDPLNDKAAIIKFNRLAGHFVYLNLLDQLRRTSRFAQRVTDQAPQLMGRVVADAPLVTVETADLLAHLWPRLTATEQRVLQQRLATMAKDRQIAAVLHLSHQRIAMIRRQIGKKLTMLQMERKVG